MRSGQPIEDRSESYEIEDSSQSTPKYQGNPLKKPNKPVVSLVRNQRDPIKKLGKPGVSQIFTPLSSEDERALKSSQILDSDTPIKPTNEGNKAARTDSASGKETDVLPAPFTPLSSEDERVLRSSQIPEPTSDMLMQPSNAAYETAKTYSTNGKEAEVPPVPTIEPNDLRNRGSNAKANAYFTFNSYVSCIPETQDLPIISHKASNDVVISAFRKTRESILQLSQDIPDSQDASTTQSNNPHDLPKTPYKKKLRSSSTSQADMGEEAPVFSDFGESEEMQQIRDSLHSILKKVEERSKVHLNLKVTESKYWRPNGRTFRRSI